jgi:hypothetical protein
MTVTYFTKQLKPSNTNLTDLYEVTADIVVSKIVTICICNQSSSATTFRIAQSVGGGAVADKDYIYYDEPISGNRSFFLTTPIFANAGDIIRVKAGAATLSFNLHAQETA